jgi:hypothetical protein
MKEQHNIAMHDGADDVEQTDSQNPEFAGRPLSPVLDIQASDRSGRVMDGRLDLQSSQSRTTTIEDVKDAAAREPHFDAAGRFIHQCECGREASFGFGANLRKGRLGTWYCAACKPPECSVAGRTIILRTVMPHENRETTKDMDTTLQKPSFVYDGSPHPVELLRDQRGVYGIGVSDLFDLEAVAWSCGIEPEPHLSRPSRVL